MPFRQIIVTFAAILLVSVATPSPGAAQDAPTAASPWAAHEHGRLRLVSAGERIGDDGALRLGLHFRMQPGWKIYWRSPGEAGYPPRVDWRDSRNLADASLRWPVPKRFQLFGLETFGYGGEVVLPVRARAADPGEPVVLRAKVDYLTCAEICVPRRAQLNLTIPPGAAAPSEHAHLIDKFRARVPGDGASSGLSLTQARLSEREPPTLAVTVTSASAPFEAPDAVVEGVPGYDFAKPRVEIEDDGRRAVLRLPAERGPTAEGGLEGRTATLTVFDGVRGLEREITLGSGGAAVDGGMASRADGGSGGSRTGPLAYAGMLGLAVLGGLILNLMPCVLPVLSLKLLKAVGHGGRELGHVRASFLASAAGILASFMVLAAGAIALKAAGTAVGWGMQFQQPAFLVALTLVVTLFACNLVGFFEIPLPRVLAGSLGATQQGEPGMAGHFLTGALATLLATPCSAPFLGTAVAFALSRGPVEIAAIFAALGLGLALPYLGVAAVPSLAARMPRPGPWMTVVKRILALALAGTAVWLISVLAAQVGMVTALTVGALMAALGLILALSSLAPASLRRAVPAAVVLIAAAAFAAPPGLGSAPARVPDGEDGSPWRPLDTERIDRLVARDKVVFVDVTADWCITCKVNKAAVIDSEAVQTRLERDDVVRMRGDWTRPSEAIAGYLASFGRYGIPFNAVYGPREPDGVVLPEILTKSAVLDAIERVGPD